ncbi:MAG TPA: ribosome assembly RNA-binding protein YhbY [Thermoanaerobaculia bacterium]|nr:ribosome assembly RNA-binding protein YhbY [Thermoanaerobaculia bacterium]
MDLSSKQRQYLRGLAHDREPIVRLGKSRITEELTTEANRSLAAHELIKVRIEVEGARTRKDLAARLAEKTASSLVGTIGKVAILYRAREEDPKIRLPL